MFSDSRPSSFAAALILASLPALGFGADATTPVLVQGSAFGITALDVQADAQRIPPAQRTEVLARPGQVAQIATDLYVRRALAREAQAAALDQAPQVQAALQLARDRVLSDAMLAHIDAGSGPSAQALEGLARTEYNAHPERYKTQESVRVRHILVRGDTEQAHDKAAKLLQELRAGADFSQLAKENSQDPGSAAKGGELGFFERGKMVPEFEQTAFAMNPGQISDLVKTQFGYHILELEEHKPARQQDFAEVKDAIERGLRTRLIQDARVNAADKLRQEAKPQIEAIEAFAAEWAKQVPADNKAPVVGK